MILCACPGSGIRFLSKALHNVLNINIGHCAIPKGQEDTILSKETGPHRTFYIQENCEKEKVIHLVREGMAVVWSRINDNHGFDHYLIEGYDLKLSEDKHEQFASLWVKFVEEGIKARGHKNYLEIKYEDYCLDSVNTLKKICEFSDIPWKEEYGEKFKDMIIPSIKTYEKRNIISGKDASKINEIIKPLMKELK